MRRLLIVPLVAAVPACKRAPEAELTSGSAGSAAAKPVTRTSAEGPASVTLTSGGREVHATHTLAYIGPNDLTIFVSTLPLTCAELHGNAVMAAGGITLQLPLGPDRDYYSAKAVGVELWALNGKATLHLPPPRVLLALDRFDPKSARIAGYVKFAGRGYSVGATRETADVAGGGRFDAGICDDFGTLADPPAKPTVHLDVPFAGRSAGKPFTLAHAFAIVCGVANDRFVARLELSAAPDATCTTFWDGTHIELDTIGGSAERTPLLGQPQPSDSMVGDGTGGDSRPGTASVTWTHLEFAIGGTITGSAQVDSLGDKGSDGLEWTDASGTFSAQVCPDVHAICKASGD